MFRFIIFLIFIVFALYGCREEAKIEALKQEGILLENKIDSLTLAIDSLQNLPGSWIIQSDTVRDGNGLFQVLVRMNINKEERGKLVLGLQDSVELSKLRSGQVFFVAKDSSGSVQRFRYAPNLATIHVMNKVDTGYVYRRIEKPVKHRQSFYEGEIEKNGTLSGVLKKAGIPRRMVGVVSGVLQCKVALSLAWPGDKFRILLEDTYYQDSIWIGGKVIYAEFKGHILGNHEAFSYYDGDPKSTYNAHYTETGEALIFDGLRYPLDRLHITSSYGSRIHPITGLRTVHYGVDYGSPMGSAVHAVANGVVTVSGFDNLSGNKIAVKHRDNSVSWYMHLSARGVGVGAHVSAGQVIGRVGSTGRSTGPHLHFGFKNAKGAWMNPLSKTMIATPKLTGERLSKLQDQVKKIREQVELTLASPAVRVNDSTDVLVHTRELHRDE